MEVYDRITAFAKKKGMDKKTLIDKVLGLQPISSRTGKVPTRKTLYSWLAGRTPIEPEMLTLFASVLNTTELEFFNDSEKKKEKIISESIKNPSQKIKKYLIEAGYGTDRIKEIDIASYSNCEKGKNRSDTFFIDKYMIDKKYRDRLISAIMITGDSMTPYVNDGDIALFVVLDANDMISDGKYIIDTIHGKQLKNLKLHLDGSVTVSSENEKYRAERVKLEASENFRIIGRVVGRIMKS